MEDNSKVQATVDGDGGQVKPSEAALESAKSEIKFIADNYKERGGNNANASDYEDVLYCLWDNQHADGLKHDTDETEADPFDGALDSRVRYADMVLNEKVKMAVLALLKARPRITGTESNDSALAGHLSTLAKWLKYNHWGVDYILEMAKWVRFSFGDHPAASLMEVHYERERVLEMARITMSELGNLYVVLVTENMSDQERAAVEPQLGEDFEALRELLLNPEGDAGQAAVLLQQFFPYIIDRRAKQVIREARKQVEDGIEDPVFEFPRPNIKQEGPVLVARRIYRDVFLPRNTVKFKTAPYYYIREWLTEAELRQRVTSMDYSQDFVDKVLEKGDDDKGFEHGGYSLFEDDRDLHRGQFEILTQYRIAVNDENVPGVYVLPFHNEVEMPATDETLLDYPHGGYPGVLMAREAISNRALDSRSIPEIAGPMQGVVKGFIDASGNNANLNALPAFATYGRNNSGRLRLGMLEENPMSRNGEVKAIQVGQYPAAALKAAKDLVRMYDEYFGRANNEIPQSIWQSEMEWLVLWVLGHAAQVWKMAIQYVQEYMPQPMLERIIGARLDDMPGTREEIRGQFDIVLEYDGRDFDFEFVKSKAELFTNFLMKMDARGRGNWTEALKAVFEGVDPNLAERVLPSEAEGEQSEIEDEQNNIMKIMNGFAVPMAEGGQNFPLRLQVVQEWAEANMQAIQALPPERQEALQERVKHLQFMTQQIENARIGRVGAQG